MKTIKSPIQVKQEPKSDFDFVDAVIFSSEQKKGLKQITTRSDEPHSEKIFDPINGTTAEDELTIRRLSRSAHKGKAKTPNDKIYLTNPESVPQLRPKSMETRLVSKFFLNNEDPDSLYDEQSDNSESISPCKNVKLVKNKKSSYMKRRRRGTDQPIGQDTKRIKTHKNEADFDDILIKTQILPVNSNQMVEIMPEKLITNYNINFVEWAQEGLSINSQYDFTIRKLIVARLRYSTQINDLKQKINQYVYALQDHKSKIEEKSSKLQQTGKRFVNEAKSY